MKNVITFESEFEHYLIVDSIKEKWFHLERMHVIGQQEIATHYLVHILMLKQSAVEKNISEFLGQIFRLLLVLPGHLLNRIPVGNVGSARVSAFVPMSISDDLKENLNKEK